MPGNPEDARSYCSGRMLPPNQALDADAILTVLRAFQHVRFVLSSRMVPPPPAAGLQQPLLCIIVFLYLYHFAMHGIFCLFPIYSAKPQQGQGQT